MTEIIDDQFNRKERVITDIYFRKALPGGIVRIGYVILVMGVIWAFAGDIIGGIIVAVAGALIAFSYSGVLIDSANREAKHYTAIYGLKKGEWVSLKGYPYISILRSKTSYRVNSIVNQMAVTEINYDVYLLSKTHRDRFLLKTVESEIKARENAKELGQKLGVEYANYNPHAKSRLIKR